MKIECNDENKERECEEERRNVSRKGEENGEVGSHCLPLLLLLSIGIGTISFLTNTR